MALPKTQLEFSVKDDGAYILGIQTITFSSNFFIFIETSEFD